MARHNHKPSADGANFKERRTKGRVVAFRPDIVATPGHSPARILQESLARRTRSAPTYIADPVERRMALIRFVATAGLLWGGMVGVIAVLMIAAS